MGLFAIKDHVCVTITTSTSLTFHINVCIEIRISERERWGRVLFLPVLVSSCWKNDIYLLCFPPDIDPQMKFILSRFLTFPSPCKHVKLICHSLSKASLLVYFLLLTQPSTYIITHIARSTGFILYK